MPLFSHRGEVTANTAKGKRTSLGSESPRDFLLDFYHPQILFRAIIRKWHAKIVQEQEEGRGVTLKPIKQILRFGLFDSAFLFGQRVSRRGLSSQARFDELIVGGSEVLDDLFLQSGLASGLRLFDRLMTSKQMLFEFSSPHLLLVFVEEA